MAKKRKGKAKMKPSKPAAAKRASKAEDAQAARDQAVRQVARQFQAAIPNAAVSSGHHAVPDTGAAYPQVPDGIYRIGGDAWAFVFKKNRWVEAIRVGPPAFGGPDVVAIEG